MTTLAHAAQQPVSGEVGSSSSATYDWHGVVGIRLIDWRQSDIRGVERQLGLQKTGLDRPPDLTVRFVDRLPLMGGLAHLGSDAAFAGDAFLLTAGADRRPVAQVPFASLGSSCEILVVRGASAIPLLVPMLNLTALQRGYLPVLASAFVYGGMGVLVAGGESGGTTGTLLGFTSRGATYVGDGWVLVHPDGRAMYGLPAPMQVTATYLRALPEYRARLDMRTQRRMRLLGSLLRLAKWVPVGVAGTSVTARARGRVEARLAAGLTARVSPHRLFGAASRLSAGSPDIVVVARRVESGGVEVTPIRPVDVVRRLTPLLENEWRELDRYYKLYRSAFPSRRNELIEKKMSRLESGLQMALKDKRAYEVRYRPPVPIGEIVRVVEPLISSDSSSIELCAEAVASR